MTSPNTRQATQAWRCHYRALLNESAESAADQFAKILAQCVDIPQAIDWLEVADGVGDTGVHYVLAESLVGPLRSGPRFKALLIKVNVP